MESTKILAIAIAVSLFTACQPAKTKHQEGDNGANTEFKTEPKAETPAVDFTMSDMQGTQVKASEVFAKHKITIIDFWASWCGPCRQEMPNLVKLYDEYNGRGLGILGVSLDEDKDDWTSAVKELGMTWTQVSDLQGWDNSVARQFNVRGIPFTMIVDSKGHIITTGLRGEELEAFVAEYMK